MKLKILFLCLLLNDLSYAQDFLQDISFYFNYTNTSKLFLQPKSSDPVVRATYNELRDIYSFSCEIRFRILESVFFGLWGEFMQKTFTNKNINFGAFSTDTKDGYRIFPVEVSLYYFLPFSTDKFKFYMGGGAGIYFANYIREIENITAVNNRVNLGYGIQVSVILDYIIYNFISLRTQIRFRDPEIDMKNKYSNNTVTIGNRTYKITMQNFDTKVNVDGITFSVGISCKL
ncbi:MAG: hypothetical protein N2249_06005 [Melioribacter sp.]|nr:hypothetical protein [Melioribacter sp.]